MRSSGSYMRSSVGGERRSESCTNLGLVLLQDDMTRELGLGCFGKSVNHHLHCAKALKSEWVAVRSCGHETHAHQFREVEDKIVTPTSSKSNLLGQTQVKVSP